MYVIQDVYRCHTKIYIQTEESYIRRVIRYNIYFYDIFKTLGNILGPRNKTGGYSLRWKVVKVGKNTKSV